jgi:hypothetical protein
LNAASAAEGEGKKEGSRGQRRGAGDSMREERKEIGGAAPTNRRSRKKRRTKKEDAKGECSEAKGGWVNESKSNRRTIVD